MSKNCRTLKEVIKRLKEDYDENGRVYFEKSIELNRLSVLDYLEHKGMKESAKESIENREGTF